MTATAHFPIGSEVSVYLPPSLVALMPQHYRSYFPPGDYPGKLMWHEHSPFGYEYAGVSLYNGGVIIRVPDFCVTKV